MDRTDRGQTLRGDMYALEESEPHFGAPAAPREPKPRGCCFYGCVTAAVVFVLLLVVGGFAAYKGWQWYQSILRDYTGVQPQPLPPLALTDEQQAKLFQRVDGFSAKLKAKQQVEPLVLTADELNAIVERVPEMKGRVRVAMNDDRVTGKVAVPLDFLPCAKGRWLNGSATLKLKLEDGLLTVRAEEFEIAGKPLPAQAMEQLRRQNLAEDKRGDAHRELLRRFERIEIKGGKLILVPKPPAAQPDADPDDPDDEDPEKPKAKDGKPPDGP